MKTCYYDLLEVTSDASDGDLKKAYRKKALQYHPDKNRDNIDEATELFAQIRCAYEVLSDSQERAWYDSHKEQILSDDLHDLEEEDDYTVDSSVTGVTTEELLRFFNGSMYTRNDDTPAGIYQIAGKVFAKLASDEVRWGKRLAKDDFVNLKDELFDNEIHSIGYILACEKHRETEVLFPSFGYSKTEYQQLKAFYKKWTSFSTLKNFSWKDEYMYSKNYDRRTKREILKRNEKLRSQAKNEYNKTVKRFVSFIKKFDKRIKEGAKRSEEEKKKKLEVALKNQIAKDKISRKVSNDFQWQDWQQVDEGRLEEIEKNFDDGKSVDTTEEIHNEECEEITIFECFVCNKNFKSENQLENHTNTKNHRKAVRQLQFEMRQESIALGLDNISDADEFDSALEDEEATDYMREQSDRHSLSLDEIDEELNRIDLELKQMENANASTIGLTCDVHSFETSQHEDVTGINAVEEFTVVDLDEEEKEEGINCEFSKNAKEKYLKPSVTHEKSSFHLETSDNELDKLLASLAADSDHSWNSTDVRKKKKKKPKKEHSLKSGNAPTPNDSATDINCGSCGQSFDSRNKMFKHLENTGHASLQSNLKTKKKKSDLKSKKRGNNLN